MANDHHAPDAEDHRRTPPVKRRVFLQIVGAGAMAASCSTIPPNEKLVPYLTAPEGIPGKPLHYRGVCRECPAGCGVTARTREGRVLKLEGNPEDPIGRGALCARGQAAVQRLYAPDRIREPMARGADGKLAPIPWTEALALAAKVLGKGSMRLLTRPEPGSAGSVQRAFLEKAGAAPEHRVVLDPLDPTALRAAGKSLFGRPELPAFDLAAAKVVVSFGADFLETWVSPVELTRGLSAGRGRVEDRHQLVWVGPRLSLTGAAADTWARTRPGGELAVAQGILRWIADPENKVGDLPPEAPAVFAKVSGLDPASIERASGLPWARIAALGKDLADHRPSALLGPGVCSSGPEATALATVVQLVNYLLGNIGRTVRYGLDPSIDPPATAAGVVAALGELASGEVEVLLVHRCDPVGTLPSSLGAEAAIGKVPFVVSFSDHLDATTERAHLVLPDHHALESFGDVSPRKGVVALLQPAMRPLGDTRSMPQTLIDLAQRLGKKLPWDDFYACTQTRDAALSGGGDADAARRAAQQRGGYYTEAKPEAVTLHLDGLAPLSLAAPPPGGQLTLAVFPTTLRYDGSTDTPWLREVPDALSGIAWTTWVELGPGAAAHLGIRDGELVEVRSGTASVELPAVVHPGLHDEAVAIPLGDRAVLGLLPASVDPRSGALSWSGVAVTVVATGRKPAVLARADFNPFPDGREVLRSVTPAKPTVHHEAEGHGMTPEPHYPAHRWAMTIDLDRCTGCQACVVACYAENNVPVMGPEGTAEGRNMAWVTLQRYATRSAEDVTIDFIPALCQQCDNAPCETVCPVEATYHTEEGLNAQVYNRCVGTRYCSNNCPYKARAFNWWDPKFPAPLDLQLNPDVNVRMRGVMEKCTFCVQRIRLAENDAKTDLRRLVDGDVVPACAQTCPAEAIVFGDLKDPRSKVARLSHDPRGYHLLEELNTRPAVTYLARVRRDAT